jgi:uncharacterized repeat protein (TIGR02543 family)
MKKFLFLTLSALMVFGLVLSCGGNDDPPPPAATTYTIAKDLNWPDTADGTPPSNPASFVVTKVGNNAYATAAQIADPLGAQIPANHTPKGWFTAASGGTKISITYNFTASGKIYAQWDYTAPVTPGMATVTFDSQGGVPATQTTGEFDKDSVIPTDMLALINLAPTKVAVPNIFGGWFENATGGTALSDAEIAAKVFPEGNTKLYVQWLSTPRVVITRSLNYEGAPAGTTVTIDAGGTLRENQLPRPAYRPNFLFLGWFLEAAGTTPVVATETVFEENATNTHTIYAKWEEDVLDIDEDDGEDGIVEKVTVLNAWSTIYRFDLASGARWSDYEEVTVEYKLGAATLADGMARAIRLLGNYRQQDFEFMDGTGDAAGKHLAIARWDNRNASYILANEGGAQADRNMSSVLETVTGSVPDADTWFTVNYTIDGSKKNGSYVAINKPVPDAHGPFYFGIGLPGGPDAANTFLVKNVTLVARTDSTATDVIATPAIFDIDGTLYPAFGGYPTVDGTNGFKEATREIVAGGDDFEPIEVSGLEPYEVLLTGKTVTNATAWVSNYNNGFVIPIGPEAKESDWEDPDVPEYEVIEDFPWTKVTIDFKYYAYEEEDGEDDEGEPITILVKKEELIDVSTFNMNSLVQMKYHAVPVGNANGANVGTKYNLGDPNDGGGSYQDGAPLSGAAITMPAISAGLWGLGFQAGGGGTKDFWGYFEVLRIVFHD